MKSRSTDPLTFVKSSIVMRACLSTLYHSTRKYVQKIPAQFNFLTSWSVGPPAAVDAEDGDDDRDEDDAAHNDTEQDDQLLSGQGLESLQDAHDDLMIRKPEMILFIWWPAAAWAQLVAAGQSSW